MDRSPRKLVTLSTSERFKLYLPLGVEAAAKSIFKDKHGVFSSAPEAENEFLYTPESAFWSYVSKLAQVVDNKRGGDTVTSFVVLKDYEKTNFKFCSNQRDTVELEEAKVFVENLLTLIKDGSHGSSAKSLLKRVLWHILLFNIPRIAFYLKALTEALQHCIEDCSRKNGTYDLSVSCRPFRLHSRRARI